MASRRSDPHETWVADDPDERLALISLAVTLFVAAGFQHSPANMSYFSLSISAGGGPALGDAIIWNLVPAGLGNVLGGTFMVALPFWLAYGRPHAVADDRGVD